MGGGGGIRPIARQPKTSHRRRPRWNNKGDKPRGETEGRRWGPYAHIMTQHGPHLGLAKDGAQTVLRC
jgi:hypothetical protein